LLCDFEHCPEIVEQHARFHTRYYFRIRFERVLPVSGCSTSARLLQ
jgi:hypothetical protein